MTIFYDKNEYFLQTEFLYKLCKEEDKNRELLTNLVIIDMVTSLEVFVERLLKEFLDKYNEIGLTSCCIDEKIKLEHSKMVINKLQNLLTNEDKNKKSLEKFEEIINIWSAGNLIKIDLDVKYPRGKHGEIQLVKLFSKIGINSVFDKIKIESDEESMISTSYLDISNFVQEMTDKRNQAIHQGVSLHFRISLDNLRHYIDVMDKLFKNLTDIVNTELDTHKNHKKLALVNV